MMMTNAFTHNAFNAKLQSLLSHNLFNDPEHQKQIEDQIINLIRSVKTMDMINELEKAVLTTNFNTGCVLVPSALEIYLCSNSMIPSNHDPNNIRNYLNNKLLAHLFSGRVWRWPDLTINAKLKSTLNCECRLDVNAPKNDICINPYHYERFETTANNSINQNNQFLQSQQITSTIQSPLNSGDTYSNVINTTIQHSDASNLMLNLENAQNSMLNNASMNQFSVNHPCDVNLPPINYIEPQFWCTISYYELNHHVGQSFHASSPQVTIDGFVDPSGSDRFCLGVLTHINRTPESDQCRRLIGHGVRLYYIGGEVYAECLSENPIFVQSPISNTLKGWHPATVCKITTGCNLKIFNNQEFANLLTQTVLKGYNAVFQLTRMCTIRISFAKGWGNDYKRQAITSTPCWIEIRLNGPFQWLDRILLQMSGPGLMSS